MFIARLIGSWFLASGVFGSIWAAFGLASTKRAMRLRAEQAAVRAAAIAAVPAAGDTLVDGAHGPDRINDLEAVRRRARFRVIPGGARAVPA